MDILIINPNSELSLSAGKLKKFLTPMPPIGLAYLLAAIEKSRHQPLFYDDFLASGNNPKLIDYLKKQQPHIIGLPLYTSSLIYRVEEIVSIIRDVLPSSKIVLGNLHANYFAEDILKNNGADFIITGEGELTICELADALEGNTPLKDVKGICYMAPDGTLIQTEPRPYVEDLDSLPFPAWHLMPFDQYDCMAFGKIAESMTFIQSSRGCPFNCSFCSLRIQGRKRRVRSVQNVCDEIESIIDKFQCKSFHFIDPIFPISEEEGINLCNELIKRGLHQKMVWATQLRIELTTPQLLDAMYKSGCRRILFGIESGSKKVLSSIDKNDSLEIVEKSISIVREAGISVTGLFMIGLPGETKEDIESTIRLAIKLDLDFAKFAVFVPYPGTAIYEELVKKSDPNMDIQDLTNWNRYTSYPTKNNPPIYVNREIGAEGLIALQQKAMLKFYFRPKIILRMIKGSHLSLKTFWDAFMFFIVESFNLIRNFFCRGRNN